MSETSAIAPTKTAPAALWAVAENFLNILYNLFGPPERVAFQHTFTKAPYQLLLSWLRAGEALMRRLILIEAANIPPPARGRLGGGRRRTDPHPIASQSTSPLQGEEKRPRKLMGFDDDKPEDWRVSFRCFNPDRRLPAGRKRCRQDAGGPKFCSAWPLAERYEALLRVFTNPAPYAKRLAARLHATPHRLQEVLHLPKRRRERWSGEMPDAPDLVGRFSFERIEGAARGRWPAPNTS